MNQRSMLPVPQLRREPTTASGSFSVGASAWSSRCPTTGAPAPRCSISNASSGAEEKQSCCCPASQRSLVNSEPSPGPASPDLAVPASATSPGAAPSEGRAVELPNRVGTAGCGRAHLSMHRACAGHVAEMWPLAHQGYATNRKLMWLPKRLDVALRPLPCTQVIPQRPAGWRPVVEPAEAADWEPRGDMRRNRYEKIRAKDCKVCFASAARAGVKGSRRSVPNTTF